MKTPMQELIEQLKKEAQFISDNDHIEDRMWRNGLREAIERAESMLDKEKEIIETAFLEGRILRPLTSEQWYNETFNTK